MEAFNTLPEATEDINCLPKLETKEKQENGKQTKCHSHYTLLVECPTNLKENFESGAKIFQQQSENFQLLY